MPRPRQALTCLLLLGLLALALPVAALADGGGSAGDQQYVDPLAHQPTTPHSSPSRTPSAPTPAPTSTPASPSSSASTLSANTSTTPTATTASGTTTSSSSRATVKAGQQLPYTGYDGRLAAGLGFVLVLGGVGLRRRARRT